MDHFDMNKVVAWKLLSEGRKDAYVVSKYFKTLEGWVGTTYNVAYQYSGTCPSVFFE